MILLQVLFGSAIGRVGLAVAAAFVAFQAYGISQRSIGAAKERERAQIAGNDNVRKAEKARAAVRGKPDPDCLRDPFCRDR